MTKSNINTIFIKYLCYILLIIFLAGSKIQLTGQSYHDHRICNHNEFNQKFNRTALSKFVRKPPIITSFLVTEDRFEKIQVEIKETFRGKNIRIRVQQNWKDHNENKNDVRFYDLYDDGRTGGDAIADDLVFTNDQIVLISSKGITNWEIFTTHLWIDLLEEGIMLDRNKFQNYYVHTTPAYLSNLDHPKAITVNQDSTFVATNRFIYTDNYTIKYNSDNTAVYDHNNGFWTFENIDSFLISSWSENDLGILRKNNNIRTEVPLITYDEEPTTEKIHISLQNLMNTTFLSLNHEILHEWIPLFYFDLGDYYFNHQGKTHHPVIFRNTSGFLGPNDTRIFDIICEDAFVVPSSDTKFIDFKFRPCPDTPTLEGKSSSTHAFNDLELFIMGLLPVDSLQLPIYYLKDTIKTELLADTALRIYYNEENVLAIGRDTLIQERNKMIALENMIDGDSLNMVMNYVGNRKLSQNEIRFLYHLSKDITNKGSLSKDDVNQSLTYYEATKGKGILSSQVTKPSCLEGVEISVDVLQPPTCYQGSDARALLNISGIEESLIQVIWDDNTIGLENLQLKSGIHEVHIKNINHCDISLRYEIPEGIPIELSVDVQEDTLSSATVKAVGGHPPYTYLWNDPLGQTSETATGLPMGRYTVTVTDSIGCTASTTLQVATLTGNVDHQLKQDLRIFPNPASDKIIISLTKGHSFRIIEIIDLDGKSLQKNKVIGKSDWTVLLSGFNNGIYFARAKTLQGEITIPFIVSR